MAFKVKFAILTSFVILFAVLYYNAFILNQPCRHKLNPINESDKIQLSEAIKTRLQDALSIRTISSQENQNTSANIDYINFIRKEFAKIEKHPYVKLTLINKYSMLYKIEGKDTNLKPYLLAAHYDVVPVNEDEWSYSPFGESRDGFIYGRGTMDDKGSMIAQLEAVQSFLEKHGQPKRTIYLAYGHDEEVTGYAGAGEIAKYLGNIQLEYVIDEGTLIIEDLFPELGKPVALVSIADKGYLTLKFSVNVAGGHSSMPDTKNSAIFILAEAITRLKNNKFPSLLGQGPELLLLKRLGSNMGFFKRLLLSNVWFFKPLIDMIFSQQPSTDSVLRTTTSVNIFKSGVKENVLPSYGEFYVNHRIHPSQTCQEVIDYDLKVINDPQIKFEVVQCVEPSPVSSTESLGYMIIDHSTREVYNDLHVLPSVMVGLTDSRFYYNNTKDIYKYLPAKSINADLKGYHGANERLSWESYKEMINFYFVLIRNTEDSHLIKDKFKDEL